MVPDAFEHVASFDAGETSGSIRLGKFEAMYEEIFAEVLEDGVITVEERERLDAAADSMGLDRDRLRRLEASLQAAWEAHHKVHVVVQSAEELLEDIEVEEHVDEAPAAKEAAPEQAAESETTEAAPTEAAKPDEPAAAPAQAVAEASDPRKDELVSALRKEVEALRARVRQLEHDLEEARNNVSIEVDLGAAVAPVVPDDPTDLQRRIRQDPTDPEPLHGLFKWAKEGGKLDEQWCVASALTYLGQATAEETEVFEANRSNRLPRPTTALSPDGWRKLLFHPDEELLVGDIFGVITSAVLLGRVAALRRDKLLPKLDPARRQDPETSTVSAVRAVAWTAATLGMHPPPIFLDPDVSEALDMVPGVPPVLRIGSRLLKGRTPLEAAFECGRGIAKFREEHFVRFLFPGVPDLEDIFLVALSIANPALPIPGHAKARVEPIAAAILPVLEAPHVDRLRGYFLRFVEEGGRTNLMRWAHGVDKTACRAGFLACNDLITAGKVLADEEGGEGPGVLMSDLLAFCTSERYFNLRKQLGIALD